jgi:serine protease inhibitor
MKIKLLTFLLLVSMLFSCNKDIDNPGNKIIKLDAKSEQLIESDNVFGLDMFKEVYNDSETPQNFMISPLSISLALAMAYNGAAGETKAEMQDAMRLNGLTPDEINKTYQELIAALVKADDKVTMEIANSIWYRNDYPVLQSFLDINSTYYDAEVNATNFNDPATVGLINNWVSDKTHEKIPEIIQEIPIDAVMYLINAIYFYGTWTKEFNPESTQPLGFYSENGNMIQADMMGRKDSLDYLSNETFSAIKLPYGRGNFNMVVMLPNEEKTVTDIVNQLNSANWGKWLNAFKLTNSVDIRLPKFKIKYDITLNTILQSMGMKQAFTSIADFSSINPAKDLYISYVKHKTFIDVDEKGTEAAAVTIIGFEATAVPSEEPQWIRFFCTHPFLFAITEKDTGAILFIGKVGNPTVE